MSRNIFVSVCLVSTIIQLFLLYSIVNLVFTINAMSTGNPVEVIGMVSIPLYLIFTISSGFLTFSFFKKNVNDRIFQLASVTLCSVGPCLMSIHLWYASYYPIFGFSGL